MVVEIKPAQLSKVRITFRNVYGAECLATDQEIRSIWIDMCAKHKVVRRLGQNKLSAVVRDTVAALYAIGWTSDQRVTSND